VLPEGGPLGAEACQSDTVLIKCQYYKYALVSFYTKYKL